MGVSDNYSVRESAGTLNGTETVPLWKDGKNVKTTAQDIADLASGGTELSVSDTTSIDLTLTNGTLTADAKFGTTAGTVAQGNHTHTGFAPSPTTAGTVEASKAVVVNANKDASGFRNISAENYTGTDARLTNFRNVEVAITNSGVVTTMGNFYQFYKDTGAIAASIAFDKGRFVIINKLDTGPHTHTLTLLSGTWNGTNTVASFDAAGDTLIGYTLDNGRFMIILNNGVTFS